MWLITGGCGFVGSNLADALAARGDEIAILDNLSRVGSAENLKWLRSHHGNAWRFIEADVRDAATLMQIVGEIKPDVIAHVAGQVAMTTSINNPRLDFEVNAGGTFNILESVRLYSPYTVVLYSSSNKVYGELNDLVYHETDTRYSLLDYPDGLDEQLPLEGHSPYGCSKLTADQYLRDYHRIYGLRTIVFRHSSMYGGRQFATYDQGWIGWFCLKALEMADAEIPVFTISGTGKQVRDVLHAEDLVQVYLQAADQAERIAGQIYNIGGGIENSLSLLELFALLEDLTGNKMRFRQIEWRAGDQKVFVADYRKAQRGFGWHPKVNKQDGLRRMLEWSRLVNKFLTAS